VHFRNKTVVTDTYLVVELTYNLILKEQGMDILRGSNHEFASVPPVESYKQGAEK